MSRKKYLVTLTKEDGKVLHDIINRGKHGAQKRKRAQALLLAHEGYTDEMITERAGMGCRAIESLRQRFVEDGFEVTLENTDTKTVSREAYRFCQQKHLASANF
jgi:hypothetical protein